MQSIPDNQEAPLDKLQAYDYELPAELVAQYPLAQRSASRLLKLDPLGGIHDAVFIDVLKLIRPNDLVVFNDTKVLKARLYANKTSGGHVQILIERVEGEFDALVQLKASHKPKIGSTLVLAGNYSAVVLDRQDHFFRLQFDAPVLQVLEAVGELPLPPYIQHAPDQTDLNRYQTVYAQHLGAVAAPTAGLHFDQSLLDALHTQGTATARVTLHVGAGTFAPVRTENITEHTMHKEWYDVPQTTVQAIAHCKNKGGRVIAVGTTTVRSLESAAMLVHGDDKPALQASTGQTQIFITPGFKFKVVDCLITNFHLPKSTLMMLVSAFAGYQPIRQAYAHAVQQRYRFFSYGDAMFLERHDHAV